MNAEGEIAARVHWQPLCEFRVDGKAVPWTAPSVTKHGAYSSLAMKLWKHDVGWSARAAYKGKPFEHAVHLRVSFYQHLPKRAKKHQRGLYDRGMLFPCTKPDLTNLVKALEDALQGVVYLDDKQVVRHTTSKHYALDEDAVYITVLGLENYR